jgi:hypothetical protein
MSLLGIYPLTPRSIRLVVLFALYVIVLLAFAAIYYLLYRKDPLNYQFNADVATSQQERYLAEEKATTAALALQLAALREVGAELSTGRSPTEGTIRGSLLLRTNSFAAYMYPMTGPPGGGPVGSALEIQTADNRTIRRWEWSLPVQKRTWTVSVDIPSLSKLVPELASEIEYDLREHTEALQKPPRLQPVWSYFDFVYFSGITLTTVGFGDILPNNTRVRMIVLAEILTGVILLVVVLNVIMSN